MNRYTDLHAHSNHSLDGTFTVETMAKKAIELDLAVFCLTDHCDYYPLDCERDDGFRLPDPSLPIKKATEELRSLKTTLPQTQTKLLAGVELGQPTQDETRAKEFLSEYDLDFVIGSLHNLAYEDDFYFMDFTKVDLQAVFDRYFDELIEMTEQNLFDVVGHITYPWRYLEGNYGLKFSLDSFFPKIDHMFKILIKNGKGIEVNTSGLRQTISTTMPNEELILRYKKLGGEIITVGSDAHDPEHVNLGIAQAYEMIKQCGFDKITYFENRKPQYISLT